MARRGKSKTGNTQPIFDNRKRRKASENKILHSYDEKDEDSFIEDELDDENDSGYHVGVNSDDDEEIDSDEAFDEEDDKKFADWSFSASKAGSVPKKKIIQSAPNKKEQKISLDENEDLNEQSEDEDDEAASIDENELVDLDAVLDQSGSSEEEEEENHSKDNLKKHHLQHTDGIIESDDSFSSEDESEEEENEDENLEGSDILSSEDEESSDEEENDAKLDNLKNYIHSLNDKRKAEASSEEDEDKGKATEKKRLKHNPTESNRESEFNLVGNDDEKIGLSDLLESVQVDNRLKSSLKPLVSESSAVAASKLNAPLAKPIHDRLERQAAYEQSKEDLERWKPIVSENRKADQLVFPMNESVRPAPSSTGLASSYTPETKTEKKLDTALVDAGLKDEESMKKQEELALNKLSVEEVAERTRRLRFMRELMFREEQKAKRVSKIKSKAYRKHLKKRREKEQSLLPRTEEDLETERLRAEEARAKERMTQRHKNSSAWTRKMLERANHGEGTREAVLEQVRKGEELTKRISGQTDADGVAAEYYSDDDLKTPDDVSRAFDNVREMKEPQMKGVLGMKFMQDASKVKARQVENDMKAFEDEMANIPDGNASDAVEDESSGVLVGDNAGRRSFVPSKEALKEIRSERKNPFLSNTQKEQINDAGKDSKQGKKNNNKKDNKEVEVGVSDDSKNPWLQAPRQRKSTLAEVNKDSSKADKLAHRMNSDKVKSLQELTHDPEIQPDKIFNETSIQSESDQESDQEVPTLKSTKGRVAIQQRELVARAFAGDDVVAEFEKDKEDWINEDAPKEEDQTLPGWGSWAGAGVKQKKNKPKAVKKIAGLDPSKRKDAKLQHVIINEKRNKKSAKLTADAVPFPFESREQYERALNLPMGPEWTTRASHHKAVAPRTVTKRGKVIQPLKAPK
ncbi:U3 snoRNP protein Utp14 [Schizosaccharomyces cryophilus OY26]|uniref:U3 snoRNP protein Utp14 n=1 Tax=Schizosaccharomyces cryophilus (strain OY26 / ATCC MYA-4695 / CBS 11777 / NBRC 106824 / NRRL Y48691) TaxID=653667 RepID=S9VYV0_SCHCR|nr:U3 snoRNP protein Utp14 [Schizosaccharomyces cryophilus OY26]EPY50995.1 U3 snoRNP protein Utp14 [Schizosaccharomyces cryophilus OY26]